MDDPSPSPATILLLDSDSVMQAALRDVLQSANYLVETAGDIGEAIDRIAELPPDLLVIRPYINSMPGSMAADYLRTKCPGLPVLIVAGFMEDDRVDIRAAIRDFHSFPEPFHRVDLLLKVKEVLTAARRKSLGAG